MISLIAIALSLAAKFAPALLGKLFSKKAEDVAEKVVKIASSLTGQTELTKIEEAFNANPELGLKFQEAANSLTMQLMQEDTKRIEAVNATMQAETLSDSFAQRFWRPWNGFCFSLAILADYFFLPLIIGSYSIPITLEHIPQWVYIMWSTVLGATAWTRGQEKIAKTGKPFGKILDLLT